MREKRRKQGKLRTGVRLARGKEGLWCRLGDGERAAGERVGDDETTGAGDACGCSGSCSALRNSWPGFTGKAHRVVERS